jgi:hypothetical protein
LKAFAHIIARSREAVDAAATRLAAPAATRSISEVKEVNSSVSISYST